MGILERMAAVSAAREFPVGGGVVEPYEIVHGHADDRFSPEDYGDYIVTSNEIFSIVTLRARRMATLPLRLYDRDGPEKLEITAGPEWDLLHHVNPFWTPERLNRMDEMSMGLWGESYWAVERDRAGTPTELWWLKPSRVKPVPHPEKYLSGFLYSPMVGGKDIPFAPHEIVWFRYPNPLDEFSALSPLAAARLAADTASAMMTSNRKLFTDGMQLGGIITPKGAKETKGAITFDLHQAKRLEKKLSDRFKGVDKAHRWAVLRYEANVQPLGITPKDAEFVNGLNVTLRQACRAYGVPSPLMYDLEHATLANMREFDKALWELALVPDADFRAAEIREQLLPMFGRTGSKVGHAAYDYSTVSSLQEAHSEVWGRDRQAMEAGALTINEWRKKNGFPPVAWGDVWWAPVNKAPVASAEDDPGAGKGVTVVDADEEQIAKELAALLPAANGNGHGGRP